MGNMTPTPNANLETVWRWWQEAQRREWALLDAIGLALVVMEHHNPVQGRRERERAVKDILMRAIEGRPDPDETKGADDDA